MRRRVASRSETPGSGMDLEPASRHVDETDSTWPIWDREGTDYADPMCFYISLIVRGGAPSDIDQVLRRHRRRAKPVANASIAGALASGEAQFLTTVGHCDCGTALAPVSVDPAGKQSDQAAKLAKKGWSQSKVERWLADRAKAEAKSEESRHANTPDSVELWSRIVGDLMSAPGVQQAGLLLHFYSGDLEEEAIDLKRETVPLRDFEASLRDIHEDQLLMAA